ncbi:thiopurine S-methyltransferase [Shewanella cyperi]|uniref:Thiopurine S-methyltransferase n=1 Tax=Shewanella cyperi TaxID=2814292 RepID=A0A974XLU2_9GAMM|nr:thiopurine S-methyltransferase [Shewanella cyperi]QSX29618.1 thiopurine S-methyltransferase [Shewanella cyperi]
MEPGFWHDKWHSQQIGFHQSEINPLLVKYWSRVGLTEGSKVFVPLCGKSLDMLYLAEQGHQILGSELNSLAVEQFFSENGMDAADETVAEHRQYVCGPFSLLQGDFFTFPAQLSQACEGFYDRAALIAWPEQMRHDYAKQLAALLAPGARGLLITLDYPQEALVGPPFAVSPDWVNEYLSPFFDIDPLECLDVLADNPRFVKKQVPWLNEAAYLLVRK